jgi:hypothetical protein
MSKLDDEVAACTPLPLKGSGFNHRAVLPYGLEVSHVRSAMEDFIEFLGFVNTQLHTKQIERLESMLMAANFSSMVGEFMGANIPKYCRSLARNRYHNGHPDLIPAGQFQDDAVQYAKDGIEVKASRYDRGWQGHNPEQVFLMVFVFESNGPRDDFRGVPPAPFRFKKVVAADLEKCDWNYAGRSDKSRRTITASVTNSGYEKMMANWLYKDISDG